MSSPAKEDAEAIWGYVLDAITKAEERGHRRALEGMNASGTAATRPLDIESGVRSLERALPCDGRCTRSEGDVFHAHDCTARLRTRVEAAFRRWAREQQGGD